MNGGGKHLCYKYLFCQPDPGLKGEPGVSTCLAGQMVMTLHPLTFCGQANGLPVLLGAVD